MLLGCNGPAAGALLLVHQAQFPVYLALTGILTQSSVPTKGVTSIYGLLYATTQPIHNWPRN
jgi:hypothetical protein